MYVYRLPKSLHRRKRITNLHGFLLQDLERFFNTFVVFNCIRELGRYFVNQSGYYLTVAGFSGSQLVNRDAALLIVVWFHTAIGVGFRLELSNSSPRSGLLHLSLHRRSSRLSVA
jgi:hypothetical protein